MKLRARKSRVPLVDSSSSTEVENDSDHQDAQTTTTITNNNKSSTVSKTTRSSIKASKSRKNEDKFDSTDDDDVDSDSGDEKPTTKSKSRRRKTKKQPSNGQRKPRSESKASAQSKSPYFSTADNKAKQEQRDNTSDASSSSSRPIKLNKNVKKASSSSATADTHQQQQQSGSGHSAPPKAKRVEFVSRLETDIDSLLRTEKATAAAAAAASTASAQVAKHKSTTHRQHQANGEDDVDDDDDEDKMEWEEVDEMSDDGEDDEAIDRKLAARVSKEPIQIKVSKTKTTKKAVDLKARMERMLKAMQKKLNIAVLKTHLLCWLNHGFYLNKLSLDGVVRATALSIDKLNPPSPADGRGGCLLLNTSELLVVIERVRGSLAIANTAKFLEGNEAITAARLAACMSDLECVNYLHFVLIVLTVLRNMGARARLCVCFDTLAQSNESSQLTTTKATTSSRQLSGAKSEPNLLLINTQSKTTTTKRKSDQQKAEPVAAKKAKTTTGSGTKEEAQTEDEAKAKKKKAASILSSSDEAADKERQESTKSRSCDLRNYWLEVFVVAEDADAVKGRWCCVEPYEMKVDNAAELERRVQPRRVLYVCAYDGDNRVKDVTKRYAGDFMVATRVQRNAQLDDAKKMWWEKTLMSRQPLDVQLDIDEEKELKKMWLAKKLPTSVSEFKDHPLYVIERHLLKFQAIRPNAEPVGLFREEPVFSRDSLATLHSRQTWLKYARMVKPFEKAHKVVKGRLKMSEYKAGMRDNPDLDLFGYWQTKRYEPPFAENGRVPRNEFGNVELFQPSMLPIGCVHLRHMPNLNRVCRKLDIDVAAAVVGFDAHAGFSHAVYDGWVVCEEYRETVVAAYEQDRREEMKKAIEKNQQRILNNWSHLVKLLLIREKLKTKYGGGGGDGKKIATLLHKSTEKASRAGKRKQTDAKANADDQLNDTMEDIDYTKVGAKLNQVKAKTKTETPDAVATAAASTAQWVENDKNDDDDDDGEIHLTAGRTKKSTTKKQTATARTATRTQPVRGKRASKAKKSQEDDEENDNENAGSARVNDAEKRSDCEHKTATATANKADNDDFKLSESDDE